MAPHTTEINEAKKTAAAARSFTFFIISCHCGDIKSHRFSIAEFIISSANTKAISIHIASHSKFDILSNIPIVTTAITMHTCIHELCSSVNNIFNPLSAYKGDFNRFFIENFSDPFLFIIHRLWVVGILC